MRFRLSIVKGVEASDRRRISAEEKGKGALACSVGLGVVDGGEAYLGPELLAVRVDMAGVELLPIVNGELVRDAEAAD